MLVLLPPSEGKAAGGTSPPLDLDRLSFPALNPVRRALVRELQATARTRPQELLAALGVSPRQRAAVEADAALTTSPTLPALERYTGVLYDRLGYPTLRGAARRRADASLAVGSALFGLVRPRDLLPEYRLSGGTVLPGSGGLAARWRPVLEPEIRAVPGLVVDLRSGAYAALGRAPGAVEVRVLREADGRRTVVSHDNKYTKGDLARLLCGHGARSVAQVAELGRTIADAVEVEDRRVDLVLTGLASAR